MEPLYPNVNKSFASLTETSSISKLQFPLESCLANEIVLELALAIQVKEYVWNDVPKVVDPFYNRASLVKSQAEKKSVFEFKGKEFDKLQGQFRHIAGLIETWKEEGKNL